MAKYHKTPWHAVVAVVAGIIVATIVFEFHMQDAAFVVSLAGWCYVLAVWFKTKTEP